MWFGTFWMISHVLSKGITLNNGKNRCFMLIRTMQMRRICLKLLNIKNSTSPSIWVIIWVSILNVRDSMLLYTFWEIWGVGHVERGVAQSLHLIGQKTLWSHDPEICIIKKIRFGTQHRSVNLFWFGFLSNRTLPY